MDNEKTNRWVIEVSLDTGKISLQAVSKVAARIKARDIINNGFSISEGGKELHYPAHRVSLVTVRPAENRKVSDV